MIATPRITPHRAATLRELRERPRLASVFSVQGLNAAFRDHHVRIVRGVEPLTVEITSAGVEALAYYERRCSYPVNGAACGEWGPHQDERGAHRCHRHTPERFERDRQRSLDLLNLLAHARHAA